MSNRILLISGNFYPEPTGVGKYSGEMVDWMSENGHSCTVITTFPYYPHWQVKPQYSKSRYWFKKEVKQLPTPGSIPITIIRCPHYIPTSPTGFKRLLSEFTISFSCYLAMVCILFTTKFNYVFSIAPPFELGLLGILYKKIRGAVFVYHIQDLQIDAARDLGMIKSSFAIRTLSSIEKYIINEADYVSSISEGMIEKIKLKTDKEVIFFPNWVNTDIYYPLADKAPLKEYFGFKFTDRIILYSGAIGVKQGLESMIFSAKAFEDLSNIKFVICGSGPYKVQLEHLRKTLKINNVVFLPLQSPEQFNEFLNIADLHLIIQKSNASDLVMPSKLSTILAVGGVPITTACKGSSLYKIMSGHDMGILIEPENQEALNGAIRFALNADLDYKARNARRYAVKYLSSNKILEKYLSVIQSVKEVQRLQRAKVRLSK